MTILTKTFRIASCPFANSSCLRSCLPRNQPSLAVQLGQHSLAITATLTRPSSSVFPPSPPDHIRPDTSAPPAFFLESADDDEYDLPSYPPEPHNERAEKERGGVAKTSETTLLLNLLARGDTQRALTIKREFDELGVPLSRHPSFTQTALDIINPSFAFIRRRKRKGLPVWQPQDETDDLYLQAERFLAWWSLADLSSTSPSSFLSQSGWGAYSLAERALLIRPFSFPILSQFVLLSAQAGPQSFEHIQRGSALRCLVFYGSVGESVAFLLKLEETLWPIRKGEPDEINGRTWLWQMAVDVHSDAGREEVVKQLLDFAHRREMDVQHPSLHASSSQADMNPFFAHENRYTHTEGRGRTKLITQSTLNTINQTDRARPSINLAKELRAIKRVLFPHFASHSIADATEREIPKYFTPFVSRFLIAYGHVERRKDLTAFIHRMRDMLFSPDQPRPPPTAAIRQRERYKSHTSSRTPSYPLRRVPDSTKRAWLAAELRTYLAIKRPLAAIKTLHYFVALDPTLASEVSRVLKAARRPRKRALKSNVKKEEVDWKSTQIPGEYVSQRWLSMSQAHSGAKSHSQLPAPAPTPGEEDPITAESGLGSRAAAVGGGGYKLWPNEELLTLGWRALLGLAQGEMPRVKRRRVVWLYAIFRSLAKRSVEATKDGEARVPSELLSGIDGRPSEEVIQRYLSSPSLVSASTSTPIATSTPTSNDVHLSVSTPPPSTYPSSILPTPRQFHIFLVALSTSLTPRSGASVLADMRHLEIKPSVQSWGALAGSYARNGDLRRCERALDVIDGVCGLKASDVDGSDEAVSTVITPELQAELETEPAPKCDISVPNLTSNSQPELTTPSPTAQKSRLKRKNKWTPLYAQNPSSPDAAAYNSSIRGLAEAGCFSEASHIVRRMAARGLVRRETVEKFFGREVFLGAEEIGETANRIATTTLATKKKESDPHTRAMLSRLARYVRQSQRSFPSSTTPPNTTSTQTPHVPKASGPSPSALLRSKRRFYLVDGRRLFIDARRTEWLAEQGKPVEGFRGRKRGGKRGHKGHTTHTVKQEKGREDQFG